MVCIDCSSEVGRLLLLLGLFRGGWLLGLVGGKSWDYR